MEELTNPESQPALTELTARFATRDELDLEIKKQEQGEEKYTHTKRIDLLDTSGQAFKALKQEIEKANGLLRVFIHLFHVHPDYQKGERESGTIDYATYPPTKIFQNVADHPDRPPILLLVDEESFDHERNVFETFGAEAKNPKESRVLYLAPTLHNNGFLKLIDIEDPKHNNDKNKRQNELIHYGRMGMYRLNKLFSELGVSKLLVNGSALKADDKKLSHCVGAFMLQLQLVNDYLLKEKENGITPIKIQAGAGVVPHGRQDLRENGFEQFL